jgi:tetratricopeptide (TPR) repeat protein
MGRVQESKDAWARLAEEYPGGKLAAQASFKLAEQALAERRYGEAEAGFQRVARDFPLSGLGPQALYWGARALLESGDSRAALDAFWDCLVHGAPSALLATATEDLRTALRSTGDLALARQLAARAAGSQGLAPEAAAGIQLEYARMLLPADPEGALAAIQEVRRGAPPEPFAGEASLLQGNYFAAVGDWRRAVDVFIALESTRDDEIGARAMGEHGRALEATGRTAEAVDEFLKIASYFPDFQDLAARGLYDAGRVAGARGDVDRAAKIRETLRKKYPGSPWIQKRDDYPP